MTFLWPELLWLLGVVPVLIGIYILLLRRKKQQMMRYAGLGMVRDAMGVAQKFRRHVPPLVFLLALTALIVAVARPHATLTLPSQYETIILAMDCRRPAGLGPHRCGVLCRHRVGSAASDP